MVTLTSLYNLFHLLGVGSLLAAGANIRVDKAFVVQKSLFGATSLILVLFLLGDLGSMSLHLTSASKTTVLFT